jgi:hypothetical protein
MAVTIPIIAVIFFDVPHIIGIGPMKMTPEDSHLPLPDLINIIEEATMSAMPVKTNTRPATNVESVSAKPPQPFSLLV